MGKGIALLLAQALCLGSGVVIDTGNQNHFRTVISGGFDLADRRTRRHTDHGLHAQLGGGQSDALRVISCRAGDNTALALLLGQRTQLVVSTAELKRTGQLQVFTFDVHIFSKSLRGVQRSHTRNILQRFPRLLNHF